MVLETPDDRLDDSVADEEEVVLETPVGRLDDSVDDKEELVLTTDDEAGPVELVDPVPADEVELVPP